jgi:hypothetical protein
MSVQTFSKVTDSQITVKFFLNGDEEGTMNTKEFENEEAYQEWYVEMRKSVEIFSMSHGVIVRHPGIVTDNDGIQRFDDGNQLNPTKSKIRVLPCMY